MKAMSLAIPKSAVVLSVVFLNLSSSGQAVAQIDPPKHLTKQRVVSPGAMPSRTQTFQSSSFASGDSPWRGCSFSGGAYAYTGCKNIGPGGVPWKNYDACLEAGLKIGWQNRERGLYCSVLGMTK